MIQRAAPLVWIAYLLMPVAGWGLFAGRPLAVSAALTVAALCLVWYVRREVPAARTVTAALALKLVLGTAVLLPAGFAARYYANADFAGALEAGTEPSPAGFSRIDSRLRLGGEGDPDVPVYFTNDVNRFNFYLPDQPDRTTLPVSVVWDGHLRTADPGPQQFYARASGATVTIAIDDHPLTTLRAPQSEWRGATDIPPGFHHLVVTASFPQGTARRVEAGRTIGGRDEPFDASSVFRRPASRARLEADGVVRGASVAFDAVLLLWVLVQCAGVLRGSIDALRIAFRPRDAIVVLWALVVADALMFALPVCNRLVVLSGGDDWLTYETMSRDIGLNGLWMAGGAALGHGRSFYYQPLYPYFLAACHWVFGDHLFGIYFVQRLLIGAAVVALWRTTATLWGERVGLAGLCAAVVVAYEKLAPWSGVLLTESLFAPLICIMALLLTRLARERHPTWSQSVLVGVVGGVATLTRSTLVVGWVLVLPALAVAMKGVRRRWSALALMVLTMAAVVSFATVRNWVVAGEFVPIASSGSVNLFIGNEPPVRLQTPPEHAATYKRFGFDPYTVMVIEHARQMPQSFLNGLGRKALYALGSFDTLVPGTGTSTFYAAVWVSALTGLILVTSVAPGAPRAASAIPSLLAVAHFATVVAIFPHVYGDRLVLPLYLLLVPYVAVALVAAGRLVRRVGVDWRTALLAAVAWLGALQMVAPRAIDFDLSVTAITVVFIAVLLADRGWGGWPLWPCAAFAATLTVTFLWAPSSAAAIEYRRQLAFAALIPAIASLGGSRRVSAVVVGGVAVILACGAAVSHDQWMPLLASRRHAVDAIPAALWAAPAVLALAALGSALTFVRRTTWLALGALLAGAGLIIANLLRLAPARTALDTIAIQITGWPAAAASFSQHRWFGAGLDAVARLPAAHLESGGVLVWFVVSAGTIGTLTYMAIWLRALWATGGRLLDWRSALLHGMLLGAFAVLQDSHVAAGVGAAPGVLLLLAVIVGLSESSDVSTLPVEPRPS